MNIHSTRRTASTLLLALLVSLAALGANAQEATFSDRTEVRVVHLDVLVVDRSGSPVWDLEPSDFEVTEDGELVEIDYFESPSEIEVVESTAPEEQPVVRRGPVEWIVFVDDARLDGAARKRVLQDLEGVISGWEEGARLRLLIHRQDEIIERGPFTDPNQMIAAVRDRPKGIVAGVLSKIARRQTLERLQGIREACALSGRSACFDCWGEQLAEATRHAVDQTRSMEEAVLRLRDLLTRLNPSDGRRSLLYVGDGLPMLAGASVFWSLSELCPDRRSEIEGEVARYSQNRLFEEIGALANAQRVGLFMLDAGGLRHGNHGLDAEHHRNIQTGFLTLARETGGEAILNANRPAEPMKKAVAEERARYEIGFTLSRPPTGDVHRLAVKLKGDAARGRELSYRRTYWDRTADMSLLAQMQAAVVAAPGGSDATRPRLTIQDPTKVEKKIRRLGLAIEIPTDAVVTLPSGPDKTDGAMTLAIQVAESGNTRGQPRLQRIELGTGGLQPDGDAYRFVIGLTVEAGDRVFVVGVRDETTGTVSIGRLETRIR